MIHLKSNQIVTDALVAFHSVAGIAFAAITSQQIDAFTLTRSQSHALVLVDATVSFELVAFFTLAQISAWQIDASTSTLVVLAFVNVCTTVI